MHSKYWKAVKIRSNNLNLFLQLIKPCKIGGKCLQRKANTGKCKICKVRRCLHQRSYLNISWETKVKTTIRMSTCLPFLSHKSNFWVKSRRKRELAPFSTVLCLGPKTRSQAINKQKIAPVLTLYHIRCTTRSQNLQK